MLDRICKGLSSNSYRVFSLTWPAYMQIYWNKRKRLHKKRVQLPEDWFGTPTWPPWRHVKILYKLQITRETSLVDWIWVEKNCRRFPGIITHTLTQIKTSLKKGSCFFKFTEELGVFFSWETKLVTTYLEVWEHWVLRTESGAWTQYLD